MVAKKSWFGRLQLWRFTQIVITVLAFAYSASLIDYSSLFTVIRQADMVLLFISLSIGLVEIIAAALRWNVLLKAVSIPFSIKNAFQGYLIGSFFGLLMPGAVGGDIYRTAKCSKLCNAPVSLVAITVLGERILGVTVLLQILGFSVWTSEFFLSKAINNSIITLAILSLTAILIFPKALNALSNLKFGKKFDNDHYSNNIISLLKTRIYDLKKIQLAHLFTGLLYTLVYQLMDVSMIFVIASALNLQISFLSLLVTIPIVNLVAVIPISPSGLGIKEVTFVFVLTKFGLTSSDAALLAMAIFLNRVSIAIIGGIRHLTIKINQS